jgi:hypothetical protein
MYHIQNLETEVTLFTCDNYAEALHLAKTIAKMNGFTVGIVMGAGLKVVA